MDATDVYRAIEAVSDDLRGNLTPVYTREADPSGDPGRHLFSLLGRAQDDGLFSELDALVDRFDPDSVDLDFTAKGAHISFGFDADRIKNAPPESVKSYRTPSPRTAASRRVNECASCCRRAPDAYPPATVRHRSDSPYEAVDEEELHLCVSCTPGHFDDVVRQVKAFGVHDETVERVLFEEQRYYDDEEDRMKVESPTWYDIEEIDNPYVKDTVKVIERHLHNRRND